ncbi:MAG: hypothetical protein FWC11_00050 [Firmicutes bacterium]|nr:hypothetical protein [Bacillota bacterium]
MDKRTKTSKIPALGQIVISTMGHDRGRMYLVTKVIDHEFVEIVDGQYRKRKNPKKKRFKHLLVIKEETLSLDKIETHNDKEIARTLLMFCKDKKDEGHKVTKGGDTTKSKVSKT